MANWDETKPAGNDPISQGDDAIRQFKTDVRERMDNEHVWTATGANSEGTHQSGFITEASGYLANLAVTPAKLKTISGSPGATTYYRGDGSWQVLPTFVTGTYSPTWTVGGNVSGISSSVVKYIRTGDMVIVSGWVFFTVTSAGVGIYFYGSLPVASDFTLGGQCSGLFTASRLDSVICGLVGTDTGNNRADFTADRSEVIATGQHGGYFNFMYVIV